MKTKMVKVKIVPDSTRAFELEMIPVSIGSQAHGDNDDDDESIKFSHSARLALKKHSRFSRPHSSSILGSVLNYSDCSATAIRAEKQSNSFH